MRALTLYRPWDWAIASGLKPIENRTWKPPGGIIGERIAIHAGTKYDEDGARWMRQRGVAVPEVSPSWRIVATIRVIGWIERASEGHAYASEVTESYDFRRAMKWFTGPVGWLLADVRAIDLDVTVRGRQGLWKLPADVEAAVRAQLGGTP